jgi:2-succinyl-5-enolpyruvyl-6-hydroxy-3-cyclohexene-1-carboxylate synthase
MKISVNRNIIWCDLFFDQLADLGVKYACISPGSRSTPLIISLASNKNITLYTIVDERSSAFFALGLAKKTNTPVVLVTTSGTAVVELYPAIIEAYYQRVPLIICTADRPPVLRNSGANQTINQHNIFGNHIRYFIDAGLPDPKKFLSVKTIAENAVKYSRYEDKGPVHINFPFEKPFEPNNYTDKINVSKIESLFFNTKQYYKQPLIDRIDLKELAKKFTLIERGLILVGANNFEPDFPKQLINFSKKFGYPIYVDGATSFRFGKHSKKNVIENLTAIVRAEGFQKHFDPDLIIQFGGTPTSNVLLDFFKKSTAEKILINKFGDRNDPSQTARTVLQIDSTLFCKSMNVFDISINESSWLKSFQQMNKIASELKLKYIKNASFPSEIRIADEILENIPSQSNLMISNSLPIRDFDFFASSNNKQINIYTNRGASGIDGINSTALGIASSSKRPTFLLIGDLAFYHDLNGLYNAHKFNIPLTIILINNNGGGIFESLPIAEFKDYFTENFLTPMELNFAKLVQAYRGHYSKIKNWKELGVKIRESAIKKRLSVLEIRTDAKKSKLQRQKYWKAVANKIDEFINESRC